MARDKRKSPERITPQLPEHIPEKVELDFVGNTSGLMEDFNKKLVDGVIEALRKMNATGHKAPTT